MTKVYDNERNIKDALVAYADVDPDTVSVPIVDSTDPVPRRLNELLNAISSQQAGRGVTEGFEFGDELMEGAQ